MTSKNSFRWAWGGLFLLSLAFFWFWRLYNLEILPIFADEAIYLRWAQVMRAEPTLRFLPLSDGKQPLYMWLVMLALRLPFTALTVGRLVSVTAGFFTLLGVMFVTWLVTKEKRAFILAGWLYAILPYFVFYDRLALADGLLAMLTVWFIGLSLVLIERPCFGTALVAGGTLGLALLTKTPAVFAALLWPMGIFVVGDRYHVPVHDNKLRLKWRLKWGKLAKLIFFGLLVWLIGFGIYNLLRLGPGFEMIRLRNKDYVFALNEVMSHPTDPLRPHFNDLADWLPNLLTIPVFLAWWAGWFNWLKQRRWGLLFFSVALSLGPIMAQAAIAKVFTPRYLLFAIWPLLLPVADFLVSLARKRVFWGLVVSVSFFAFVYDWRLLTNPASAPLPRKMRSGYLEEWTAGQGIKEAAAYLQDRTGKANQNILVGTEGYFGTLPDGLQLYFDHSEKVTIIGVGQPVREVPSALTNALHDNEVYLVVNKSRFLVAGRWFGLEDINSLAYFQTDRYLLEEVGVYPKAVGPEGQDALLLFRLRERDG